MTDGWEFNVSGGGSSSESLITPLSGRYYFMPNNSNTGTMAPGNGVMRAALAYIPIQLTLSRIGGEVVTAGDIGSFIRYGIYKDNGHAQPTTLILDAGQINAGLSAVQEIVINQILLQGWYWFASVPQNVTTTAPVQRSQTYAGLSYSPPAPIDYGPSLPGVNAAAMGANASLGVTGALPDPFGAFTVTTNQPRMFVKVA